MDPLAAAYDALVRGDAAAALERLNELDAPASPGRAARHAAYTAQALQRLGHAREADHAYEDAIRLAREAGDLDGVKALRQLRHSLVPSLVALDTADNAADAARALLDQPDEALDADALVRKAAAAMAAGLRDVAAASAAAARARATNARESVLAILAEAGAREELRDLLIHEAHAIADEDGDMNLVTAVAKAARAAKLTLKPPSFG
jgi:hypothetical protein